MMIQMAGFGWYTRDHTILPYLTIRMGIKTAWCAWVGHGVRTQGMNGDFQRLRPAAEHSSAKGNFQRLSIR
ncbi:unnamed protein product [Prunus armeniaca]|uniref:Uncharacterized protein n=1 Tax=Prunus armeniaca TaxID=36596 RepID=A0A6J5VPP2_PRUAR|nr:unnamed protein product [Prunus armeniaca]